MKKAMEQSKKEEPEEFIIQYEPLNAEERVRDESLPVGLKNVGNSNLLIPPFDLSHLHL